MICPGNHVNLEELGAVYFVQSQPTCAVADAGNQWGCGDYGQKSTFEAYLR